MNCKRRTNRESKLRFRHEIKDVTEAEFKSALAAVKAKFSINKPARRHIDP